jgi:hypothetical protein
MRRADVSEQDDRRLMAEKRIQCILLDLQAQTEDIDHVNVDTRNFANLHVEIFFESERPK